MDFRACSPVETSHCGFSPKRVDVYFEHPLYIYECYWWFSSKMAMRSSN